MRENMISQAKILSKLGKNVYVKIPITFTNKEYTDNVLKVLIDNNIKMNITAIFTIDQVKKILEIIKDLRQSYQFLQEEFLTVVLMQWIL